MISDVFYDVFSPLEIAPRPPPRSVVGRPKMVNKFESLLIERNEVNGRLMMRRSSGRRQSAKTAHESEPGCRSDVFSLLRAELFPLFNCL